MVTEKIESNLVTVWDHPNSMIHSQYGRITYKAWCENEVERINKSPILDVGVMTNSRGFVCIGKKEAETEPAVEDEP